MTMDAKERAGMDVWDRLRQKMSRVAAAPERPWYQHRNAPQPGDIPPPPPRPIEKKRDAPPMPPNKGDQQWWQDRRVPRQVQEQTERPTWDGEDATSPYNEPKDRERLLRGAYQAGRNGDLGAAESFPAGSPFEQAYRQGLRDRQRGR